MDRSERLSRSESARLKRARVKNIVNIRVNNIFSRLHRLRIKRKKLKG